MTTPLDLEAKLQHPEVLSRAKEYVATGLTQGPVVVELDPTNFCDLACPGCIALNVLNTHRFSRNRLLQLPAEMRLADVRAVILIGGGEPLAHSATPALIDRLRELGIEVGLVTNGTKLGALAPLVAAQLSWVRVSLDAASDAPYARLRPDRRGASRFAQVVEGVRAVAEWPQRVTRIGISFLVRPSSSTAFEGAGNVSEIYRAAQLALDVGVDYIEYKAEMESSHRLAQPAAAEKNVIAEELREAEALLRTARTQFIVNSSLRALVDGESSEGQTKRYTTCPIARIRTTVTPDGVYVCSYHRGTPQHRIGDVSTTPFNEMWQSAAFSVDPSEDCDFHCARHALNVRIAASDLPVQASSGALDVFV